MLAVEVAQYLAAQIAGVALDLADTTGNVFIGSKPPTPDEVLAVWSDGGEESSTKSGYDMRTVQVMVRGTTDPTTGSDRADEVYAALHGLKGVTLPGGTLVVLCAGIQSGPVSIGEDDNGRHEYSLNFRMEVRNPTPNRSE
jgi:hypothetical protein